MQKIDWELITKDLDNQISDTEKEILNQWIAASEEHRVYYNRVKRNYFSQPDFDRESTASGFLQLRKRLHSHASKTNRRTPFSRLFVPYLSAACILFFILCGTFHWLYRNKMDESLVYKEISAHHLPGTDKALLFIGNQPSVALGPNTVLLDRQGIKILHHQKGGLIYPSGGTGEPVLNRLVVPRGGEYKVSLSDGSEIWLNSESTLEYPSVFQGDERRVCLSGEGYFKIAEDKTKPFIVETADAQIEVLGTEFNVSAYPDDAYTATTLIQGSVKIAYKALDSYDILTPGTQSYYHRTGHQAQVSAINTAECTSWKDKIFSFNSSPLDELMKIVSRWYDFEYKIKDTALLEYRFSGELSRKENLDYLFHVLEKVGIEMELEYKEGVVTIDKKK